MILLKSVFLIAIVAVAMIGVMVPSVFAQIGSQTGLEDCNTVHQNYPELTNLELFLPEGYYVEYSMCKSNGVNSNEIQSGISMNNDRYHVEITQRMLSGFSEQRIQEYVAKHRMQLSYAETIQDMSATCYQGWINDKMREIGCVTESFTITILSNNNPIKVMENIIEKINESELIVKNTSTPNCGTGTEDVDGICQIIQTNEKSSKGGGCLIATATYGSEMSQQVQQLRELRDNQLLQTESGTAFMGAFNDIYYSFSPTIADMEREHPLFKEAVKLAITPMISTLSLMENANSESEVLGMGLSVIMLNLGMYLAVPAIVVIGIRKRI